MKSLFRVPFHLFTSGWVSVPVPYGAQIVDVERHEGVPALLVFGERNAPTQMVNVLMCAVEGTPALEPSQYVGRVDPSGAGLSPLYCFVQGVSLHT